MTWCAFWEAKIDTHYYYIEAPFNQAVKILKEKYGFDLHGSGKYYIHHDEYDTFTLATGFERGLRTLVTPKDTDGLYMNFDPVLRAFYYLEPDEPIPLGYEVEDETYENQSIEDFEKRPDVTILRKEDIK